MPSASCRGYVYSTQYQLVWCVKFHHDVLIGQVDTAVKELLREIAQDHAVTILEIES